MTVIHLRTELIAYCERSGYPKTGETRPSPYNEERFGMPWSDNRDFIVLEKVIERS